MVMRKVRQYIRQEGLLREGDRVLVGLSGGADSVALMRLLLALGYRVEAAHCHFQLRPVEADRDEAFVRSLCATLGVPLHVVHFDTPGEARRRRVSVEMAARDLRYAWLEQVRSERGLAAIAVGHHQDDSAETLLLNLIRGTGIDGLRGIAPRRGHVVRPLLCLTRREIVDYLEHLGQAYVTDSSNLHDDYTRNKIRLHILPALRAINPSIVETLVATADHLDQAARVYHQALEEGTRRVCREMEEGGRRVCREMEEGGRRVCREMAGRETSQGMLTDDGHRMMTEVEHRMMTEDGLGVVKDDSFGVVKDDSLGVMTDDSLGVVTDDSLGVVTDDSLGVVKDDSLGVMTDDGLGVMTDDSLGVMTDDSLGVMTEDEHQVMTDDCGRERSGREGGREMSIHIPTLLREPSPEALLHHILSPLGFNSAQVRDILRSLGGQAGRRFEARGWTVVKDRERLFINGQRAMNNEQCTKDNGRFLCKPSAKWSEFPFAEAQPKITAEAVMGDAPERQALCTSSARASQGKVGDCDASHDEPDTSHDEPDVSHNEPDAAHHCSLFVVHCSLNPPPCLRGELVEVDAGYAPERDAGVACLDADRLRLPLEVRLWRRGDRFVPLGMRGSKLVSDLLTDLKVPLHERERQCVVCSGEEIVWVVGRRIDHRYRVTARTRRVMVIRVEAEG